MQGRSRNPPSPFKFNPEWLKEPSFCKLVQDLWIPITPESQNFVGILFMDNLSRVKQTTITWAHRKRPRDDQDLRDCELFLDRIINRPGLGFLD